MSQIEIRNFKPEDEPEMIELQNRCVDLCPDTGKMEKTSSSLKTPMIEYRDTQPPAPHIIPTSWRPVSIGSILEPTPISIKTQGSKTPCSKRSSSAVEKSKSKKIESVLRLVLLTSHRGRIVSTT